MAQGSIKKLITEKGFGFIEGESGELFFHHSALEGVQMEDLREGQTVEFTEGQGPKGPRAENVRVGSSQRRWGNATPSVLRIVSRGLLGSAVLQWRCGRRKQDRASLLLPSPFNGNECLGKATLVVRETSERARKAGAS